MRAHTRFLLLLLFTVIFLDTLTADSCNAQSSDQKLGDIPVLRQALADPELEGYEMFSKILKVPPAFTDTVSHRHDAELFGYVLQGSVKIKLKGRPAEVFSQGEMFYEPRNILHTLLQNMDEERWSNILLVYIIKERRADYRKEYKP
ncbi:cupin domain-containing protein [Fodinibius salsisoli]|uniref:Cupin domain-containing protein n=1 Tax=Fodinibius salsisoli TaxID=2820877 RepID=A0ABT3PI34_9BACT|nr:cupin domain-containing protein [Fodinibius salsisoli]MCW9705569.1 cupin domain-containing protein [Fodinibius salsisoli]